MLDFKSIENFIENVAETINKDNINEVKEHLKGAAKNFEEMGDSLKKSFSVIKPLVKFECKKCGKEFTEIDKVLEHTKECTQG